MCYIDNYLTGAFGMEKKYVSIIVLLLVFSLNTFSYLRLDLTTEEELNNWINVNWQMDYSTVSELLYPKGDYGNLKSEITSSMEKLITLRAFYILEDEGSVNIKCVSYVYEENGDFLQSNPDWGDLEFAATQIISCTVYASAPMGYYVAVYKFNHLGKDMKILLENGYF